MHLWEITMECLISQDLSILVFHWETGYVPSQGTVSSFRAMWCKYGCSTGLSRLISSKRGMSQVVWFLWFGLCWFFNAILFIQKKII